LLIDSAVSRVRGFSGVGSGAGAALAFAFVVFLAGGFLRVACRLAAFRFAGVFETGFRFATDFFRGLALRAFFPRAAFFFAMRLSSSTAVRQIDTSHNPFYQTRRDTFNAH